MNALFARFYLDRVMGESLLNRQDRQFERGTAPLDYLVMGDSHMQEDLRPRLLAGAFNYASSGENYVNTYYKLAYLIANGRRRFDTVLIQCDLSSFSDYQGSEFSNVYYWQRYLNYAEVLIDQSRREGGERATFRQLVNAYYGAAKIRLFGWLVPYLGESQNIVRYFSTAPQVSVLDDGFTTRPSDYANMTAAQRQGQAETRVARQFAGYEVPDARLSGYLIRILDVCHRLGVRPVLVMTPRNRFYLSELERQVPADQRWRYEQTVMALSSRYPEIRLLDHRFAFADRNDVFGDSDHLNAVGAAEYTPMMAKVLRTLRHDATDVSDATSDLSLGIKGTRHHE